MSGIIATMTDRWSDGKRTFFVGTLAFSGNYATGGVPLDLSDSLSQAPPVWLDVPVYRGFSFEYAPSTLANNGKLIVRGSGSVAATGTLTSDNTNVSDGDTVTIGTKVYTFKTALTPTEGQVLIGADADASLLNLIRAINHSGTPNTDYKCAAQNPDVSAATSVTSHAFAVTARVAGTAGNAIATTETSSHLAWGDTVLASGANETPIGTELTDSAAFPTNLASYSVPFLGIFDQLI